MIDTLVMEQIAEELIRRKPACYTTLLWAVDRIGKPYAGKLCQADGRLQGREYENEVMQEVRLRAVRYIVRNFFLRDPEQINTDPVQFTRYIKGMIKNCVQSWGKRVTQRPPLPPEEDETQAREAARARLQTCLDIALAERTKVYIKLTWLSMLVFSLISNERNGDVVRMIDRLFAGMPLDGMYRFVKKAATRIWWLGLSDEQEWSLLRELDKPCADGKRYGAMLYGDFYMAKGGEASIHDWLNRMNARLRKRGQEV